MHFVLFSYNSVLFLTVDTVTNAKLGGRARSAHQIENQPSSSSSFAPGMVVCRLENALSWVKIIIFRY
uniref:Putative secreted protein n=1 Tax=Anopheles triannulatus TaxID=58253 RepID=A0A2M4B514_9DIPT